MKLTLKRGLFINCLVEKEMPVSVILHRVI